jgi:hypothetical protein
MKIQSLIIHDNTNNVHPVYEVHTWEKAEEIIKATRQLTPSHLNFTWELVGVAEGSNDAEEVAYLEAQVERSLGLR